MITLVHLSDIHFSPRDNLSQFDLDQQIRRALLNDLESVWSAEPALISFQQVPPAEKSTAKHPKILSSPQVT
jgi:hypothetical protein